MSEEKKVVKTFQDKLSDFNTWAAANNNPFSVNIRVAATWTKKYLDTVYTPKVSQRGDTDVVKVDRERKIEELHTAIETAIESGEVRPVAIAVRRLIHRDYAHGKLLYSSLKDCLEKAYAQLNSAAVLNELLDERDKLGAEVIKLKKLETELTKQLETLANEVAELEKKFDKKLDEKLEEVKKANKDLWLGILGSVSLDTQKELVGAYKDFEVRQARNAAAASSVAAAESHRGMGSQSTLNSGLENILKKMNAHLAAQSAAGSDASLPANVNNSNYLYSMRDMTAILIHLRYRYLGHQLEQSCLAFNKKLIFVATPYYWDTLENEFLEDAKRIAGTHSEPQLNNLAWIDNKTPKLILLSLLCGGHWYIIRIKANPEKSVLGSILIDDPFGGPISEAFQQRIYKCLKPGLEALYATVYPIEQVSEWFVVKSVRQQPKGNGVDCGVIIANNMAMYLSNSKIKNNDYAAVNCKHYKLIASAPDYAAQIKELREAHAKICEEIMKQPDKVLNNDEIKKKIENQNYFRIKQMETIYSEAAPLLRKIGDERIAELFVALEIYRMQNNIPSENAYTTDEVRTVATEMLKNIENAGYQSEEGYDSEVSSTGSAPSSFPS